MKASDFKHDPDAIKKSLREVGSVLYATQPMKIYLPVRYSERGLAMIGSETFIVGIFAIVVGDKFATNVVNALVEIAPSSYKTVQFDEDDYFEFHFEAGAPVITNLDLVKRDTLVYQIYDEIIDKGNVPWYLNYTQLAGLFDTAVKHANANVGAQHEVTELIVSLIARDPKNRMRYYRQVVTSLEDVLKKPPAFVPMKSVIHAATNTLNKIAGSYQQDGIISALNNPSERVERIESILRA